VREGRGSGGPGDWVPLYLLLLAAATFSPFWWHCAPQPWTLLPAPMDVVQNVALFVPLGVATRRWPLLAALLLAALLSGGIEYAQRWLPRHPSGWDLLANAGGVAAGRGLAAWGKRTEPLRRRAVLLPVAVAALAAVLAWPHPRPPNDFSNWAPYPLVLGNEATGDRPWRGSVAELAIYDRALAADAYAVSSRAPEGGLAERRWGAGGPVLWVRFTPAPEGRLDGPQGPRALDIEEHLPAEAVLTPEGLSLDGTSWRLPEPWARHVREQLRRAGRITVAARLRSADLEQRGPARIVSLSRDLEHRNFTLAQDGRDLVFRVRTPAVGPNGMRPHAVTFDAGLTRAEHRVTAVFDGSESRIFRDGHCRGDAWIALARGSGPGGGAVGLPVAALVALAALVARALVRRPLSRAGALVVASLGGGSAWILLREAETWSHLPGFEPWSAGLGALAVLTSLGIRLPPRRPPTQAAAAAS